MNQNDLLAADAVNTFLVDFGEPIVYVPAGNSPLNIQALVFRFPGAALAGLSGAGVYKHEIQIANDPVAGVTTINKSGDKVIFANRVGGNPESFVVIDILQNDQGMWHLACG